jgi:hypothetical protein
MCTVTCMCPELWLVGSYPTYELITQIVTVSWSVAEDKRLLHQRQRTRWLLMNTVPSACSVGQHFLSSVPCGSRGGRKDGEDQVPPKREANSVPGSNKPVLSFWVRELPGSWSCQCNSSHSLPSDKPRKDVEKARGPCWTVPLNNILTNWKNTTRGNAYNPYKFICRSV